MADREMQFVVTLLGKALIKEDSNGEYDVSLVSLQHTTLGNLSGGETTDAVKQQVGQVAHDLAVKAAYGAVLGRREAEVPQFNMPNGGVMA